VAGHMHDDRVGGAVGEGHVRRGVAVEAGNREAGRGLLPVVDIAVANRNRQVVARVGGGVERQRGAGAGGGVARRVGRQDRDRDVAVGERRQVGAAGAVAGHMHDDRVGGAVGEGHVRRGVAVEAGNREAGRGLLAVVDIAVANRNRQVVARVGGGVERQRGAGAGGGVARRVGRQDRDRDVAVGERRQVGAAGAVAGHMHDDRVGGAVG